MPVTPYISVTDAQTYFDDRLDSNPWDEATAEDKRKSLATATNLINNLNFVGRKSDSSQPNAFPRYGQTDVPQAIKDATCELALQLLDQVDPNFEIENATTQSESYSLAKASYTRDFVLAHIRNGIPSSEAWAKLLPYLVDPFKVKIVRK